MMYLYFDKNKRYIGSAKEKNMIGGKNVDIVVECDDFNINKNYTYKTVDGKNIAVEDGEFVMATPEQEKINIAEEEKVKYIFDRKDLYPNVEEQFDMLFKDIDAGKFGAEGKDSEFYKTIKKIKDDNPKPK